MQCASTSTQVRRWMSKIMYCGMCCTCCEVLLVLCNSTRGGCQHKCTAVCGMPLFGSRAMLCQSAQDECCQQQHCWCLTQPGCCCNSLRLALTGQQHCMEQLNHTIATLAAIQSARLTQSGSQPAIHSLTRLHSHLLTNCLVFPDATQAAATIQLLG